MKISETAKYFNSGLMIIDMDKWRKHSISEKVINFINNNSEDMFVFHDQDALNAILYDQWHDLHPRWNAQTHIMLKEKRRRLFWTRSGIWKQGQILQSSISAEGTSLGIRKPHTRMHDIILSI